MAVFSDFSPFVQQLSVDEAFLDITGTKQLFGPPEALAGKLKKTIYEKTGLTVSAGLASNKYVAKIASGMSKPDGLFIVAPGEEEQFMMNLPVRKIWGAGPKTQELFEKHGLKSCADIHRLSKEILESLFGKAFAVFLYRAVRGQAAESFERERRTSSMSAERTFPFDLYDEFEIETQLFGIASEVFFRLLEAQLQSRTVFVKIRYGDDFSTIIARETFQNPVRTLNEFYEDILSLFRKKYREGRGLGRGIRLLGAGVSNMESKSDFKQNELFDSTAGKEQILEKSILEINKKYPMAALKRGRLLEL
jgi:DNA polymerase-4